MKPNLKLLSAFAAGAVCGVLAGVAVGARQHAPSMQDEYQVKAMWCAHRMESPAVRQAWRMLYCGKRG